MMKDKTIDQLIDEAHSYFDQSSVFEVIDSDEYHAREFLRKKYNNPPPERIEAYLEVVYRLKKML